MVYSTLDPVGVRASELIASRLGFRERSCKGVSKCLELSTGNVMAGFDVDDVNMEFLDVTPDPDAYAVIVLSRHESSSKTKSLTVHYPGNPTDEARFGGRPRELAYAAADVGLVLLRAYARRAEESGLLNEYEVTLEATHHGPTGNRKPLAFIEIGSTQAEWSDRRALEALADAVIEAISAETLGSCRPAIGLGSTHYPRPFTMMELRGEVCFGHIISKHAIKEVHDDVIAQAVQKSSPGGAREAVIEKSSVKSALRQQLKDVLSAVGVTVREV